MTHPDWTEVKSRLDALYNAAEGLERLFPERKFTLDGHLVGSIGEVVAAYMFDLRLLPTGTSRHDARTRDGREVEITLTQGKSFTLRHPPEHLIALHRPKGGPMRVVYNGPGDVAWAAGGKEQRGGQRTIGLSRLADAAQSIPASQMLVEIRPAPV